MTRLSTEKNHQSHCSSRPSPGSINMPFDHLCCGLFSPQIRHGEMLETLKTIRRPKHYRNHNLVETEVYRTYDPGRLRFPVPEDLGAV